VTLFFAMIALAFGAAMPETYGREILRTRIRYNRSGIKLPEAQSGVTISAMAHITIFTPLKMLITEPLVIMASLYLGLNFAVVVQWFSAVPFVLNAVYNFSVTQAGLAFISAIGGGVLALLTSSLIEKLASHKKDKDGMTPIETRLFGAMFGSFLVVGSLFWIGFTASPKIHYLAPIFGTAVYVWGNAMILISFISYLFDAYPPAGTLSALTAAACFRILCAGIVPIFIKDMIAGLTGQWTYGTFGFISTFMLLFPFVLYRFGPHLRSRSKYGGNGMSFVKMEMMAMYQDTRTGDEP
jgi:DHA1 family multidrug resistance protein-like MFS transporter